MNSPKSDKELDEWLELLSSSTHSPQGKFSAEKSYNILQQRLQPAYRKHKILSIRYTVAVAAGFVLLIGFGWMFYFYQRPVRTLIVSTNIQTQCIQLPDGSKVTLNRHSQLPPLPWVSWPVRLGVSSSATSVTSWAARRCWS